MMYFVRLVLESSFSSDTAPTSTKAIFTSSELDREEAEVYPVERAVCDLGEGEVGGEYAERAIAAG